jgi:glucose/mannose-6-phosphate isomerase
MEEIIKDFPRQFKFEPVIENEAKLKTFAKIIVVGMGGSNLAAGLLKIANPELDIIARRDYGLPELEESILSNSLIVASSYSGNTEEVLDAFSKAAARGLNLAAVSTGGKLLEMARREGAPYIQMPDAKIEPRFALGFSLRSLMKLARDERGLAETSKLADDLDAGKSKERGRALADSLRGFVPVIYSSSPNEALAYVWKIKFNETAKIPAFYNTFPELNHNEMTGFDAIDSVKKLSEMFKFIFLHDESDDPRIQKRMAITKELYEKRGLEVSVLELDGGSKWRKIIPSLIEGDWTSFYLADFYGREARGVPMVEKFKELMTAAWNK